MDAFELSGLQEERRKHGEPYYEFLRVPSLSGGLYVLASGATDPQGPHAEDEVYVVIDGEATIRVSSEDRPVRPGAVIYVAAGVEHRFHSIRRDLTVLVFFAPAEGSVGLA